jgi:hypothetical protein
MSPSKFRKTNEMGEYRLLRFLKRDGLTNNEVREGLEEFCWRGLVDGRRVRDLCEEVSMVFDNVCHPLSTYVHPTDLTTLLSSRTHKS